MQTYPADIEAQMQRYYQSFVAGVNPAIAAVAVPDGRLFDG